jgi:hypothetical protein
MIPGYPINYERTLEIAKREAAFGKAVEDAEEIERRWTRISQCEEYTLADLNKKTLLDDIAILLQATLIFLNKIDELKALSEHRKPKPSTRDLSKIHWGRMGNGI